MATFTAQYPGRCGYCGETIEPGDEVGFNRDDRVLHADCLDGTASRPAPEPYAPTVACPECWLVHPEGVCDR